jgi:hypothetical protein
MNPKRDDIIKEIITERIRQLELPGSEWDQRNIPADWISLITHYVSGETRRNGTKPNAAEYRNNMIKAAAIILATLEHFDEMKRRGEFR